MKISKNKLIITTGVLITLYLLLMTGTYLYAESFIQEEREQQRHAVLECLNSYFKFDRKYVDIAYNNYRVSYKQIPIPKPKKVTAWEAKSSANYFANAKEAIDINAMEKSAKELNLLEQKKWEQEYGDVCLLYELDVIPEKDFGSGWSIRIIEKKNLPGTQPGFMVYYFYPKMYAYKKTCYFNYGRPSVENALQEALDFEIKNDRSDLSEYYSKGSTKGLKEAICFNACNDYWFISKDSANTIWWDDPNEISYFGSLYGNEKPIPAGTMFNDYYKVFFERTQPTTYTINSVSQEVIDSKIFSLRIMLWAVLTLVFAIPTIFLSVRSYKLQKKNT